METAISLIADIDPALANAFRVEPFKYRRRMMVAAFHSSLSKTTAYAPLADRIAAALNRAIDLS